MEEKLQVTQKSSSCAKIALFRSLFRGRENLYPRRFESKKTGKSGYSPACGNEWVRGICEKPKIKCSECRHRKLLPVAYDVVRWHLFGHDDFGKDFVMGIYPMLDNAVIASGVTKDQLQKNIDAVVPEDKADRVSTA